MARGTAAIEAVTTMLLSSVVSELVTLSMTIIASNASPTTPAA